MRGINTDLSEIMLTDISIKEDNSRHGCLFLTTQKMSPHKQYVFA